MLPFPRSVLVFDLALLVRSVAMLHIVRHQIEGRAVIVCCSRSIHVNGPLGPYTRHHNAEKPLTMLPLMLHDSEGSMFMPLSFGADWAMLVNGAPRMQTPLNTRHPRYTSLEPRTMLKLMSHDCKRSIYLLHQFGSDWGMLVNTHAHMQMPPGTGHPPPPSLETPHDAAIDGA